MMKAGSFELCFTKVWCTSVLYSEMRFISFQCAVFFKSLEKRDFSCVCLSF